MTEISLSSFTFCFGICDAPSSTRLKQYVSGNKNSLLMYGEGAESQGPYFSRCATKILDGTISAVLSRFLHLIDVGVRPGSQPFHKMLDSFWSQVDIQLCFLVSPRCLGDMDTWDRVFERPCMVHCYSRVALDRFSVLPAAAGRFLPLRLALAVCLQSACDLGCKHPPRGLFPYTDVVRHNRRSSVGSEVVSHISRR